MRKYSVGGRGINKQIYSEQNQTAPVTVNLHIDGNSEAFTTDASAKARSHIVESSSIKHFMSREYCNEGLKEYLE